MKNKSLELHKKNRGKWSTISKVSLNSNKDLSLYYSPGVAEPCKEIFKDNSLTNIYTNRGNTIAVISDGTAILGLGDLGPESAIPVMEGKCILFKEFGGVDAVPIVLDTKNPKEIISTIKNISKSFGGINLEDISSPNCFIIENKLKEILDIPVFHDDQHGTAIVVTAALINASKITGKNLSSLNALVVGVGAAGTSVARMIKKLGVKRIYGCDVDGLISKNISNSHFIKKLFDENILDSFDEEDKSLKNGFRNTDIFIGLSRGGIVTTEMINLMNHEPWVFALSNPTPEIMPSKAIEGGAKIICTGRSDFNNQVNNLLAFPGLFRGVLDAGIKSINGDIKMVAANAIANFVKEEELNEKFILPSIINKKVHRHIANEIISFSKIRKN